ncbi:pseudouridine synthase [Aurantibacillus circumpalustris]|uniref:pseudouridine synthase n=1 Tax=Aurantibacillus circumpalustris TaxID=3036359 RepID=UPI00295AC823|nr:pseudouridine synthase [Aurantibacillus circumpalustris]
MSKFSSKKGSEDKGRSRSRSDKRPARAGTVEDKKEYKAKRSFSKNKNFRETKEDKPRERSYKSDSNRGERKPFKKDFGGEKPSTYVDRPKRSYSDERKPFKKEFSKEKSFDNRDKPKREYKERDEKPSYGKDQYSDKPRRSFRDSDDKPPRRFNDERPSRDEESRPKRSSDRDSDKKSYKKTIKSKDDKFAGFKKATSGGIRHSEDKKSSVNKAPGKRRLTKPRKNDDETFTKRVKYDEFEEGKAFTPQTSREKYGDKRSKKSAPIPKQTGTDGLMRLNKYLSNAGVASRRDADNLIISGAVKVNGVVVDKLGTKISPTDKVTYGDAAVRAERKVYLLLNKPKDYITTVDDPKERKTVMELVKGACRERIYPVGRLDRNTTGLLLFTNDGEITTKLTHPKFGVKKIYHVSLNKGLKPEDFKLIVDGLELEDGIVKADDLAFVGEGKKEVGIEIHSGRNRIVRRIFEHLGYDVLKLDRVVFAGLTKKDLPRGKHRFLTGKEISFLQMIG